MKNKTDWMETKNRYDNLRELSSKYILILSSICFRTSGKSETSFSLILDTPIFER